MVIVAPEELLGGILELCPGGSLAFKVNNSVYEPGPV